MGKENEDGNMRKGEKDIIRERKLRQLVIGERERKKMKTHQKMKREHAWEKKERW